MNFFEKLCFEKKGKILMLFIKKVKQKVAVWMHYSQIKIDIPPKITLQPEFLL